MSLLRRMSMPSRAGCSRGSRAGCSGSLLRATVVELSREEARSLRDAGLLPSGHATLAELGDPSKTVYHIVGTRLGDYRVERRSTCGRRSSAGK